MRTLGFVARGLRRDPGFAAGAVLPLALAFAATISMFAIVNQLLLRPPDGVARPTELFRVESVPSGSRVSGSISLAELLRLSAAMPAGVRLTASAWRTADLEFGTRLYQAQVQLVASNYFDVLEVRPRVGRLFAAVDGDKFDATPVAVLSKAFWESVLGADTSIVGRSVRINGVAYTVLGVAGGDFRGVEGKAPAIWVPAGRIIDFGVAPAQARSEFYVWLSLFGRRQRGIGLGQVTAIISTLQQRDTAGPSQLAPRGGEGGSLAAVRLADSDRGPASSSRIALWLLGLSFTLLTAACLNSGVLVVARIWRHERELATKRALGASSARLGLEALVEAGVLASAAAVLAAMVAPPMLRVSAGMTGIQTPVRDPRVMIFVALSVVLVSAITAVISTLVLVERYRNGIADPMRGGGMSISSRPIRAILIAQAALVLVLMAFAGKLVRAVHTATDLDLGIDRDRIAIVTTAWGPDPQRNEFMTVVRDRLAAVPGVRVAVMSAAAPLMGSIRRPFQMPARRDGPPTALDVDGNIVEPGYFAAVGMRLLGGRDFTRKDRADAPQVAIVNHAFAQTYFGNESAVDRCIAGRGLPTNACTWRIVGVVSDAVVRDVRAPAGPQIFTPVAQAPGFPLAIPLLVVVRTNDTVDEMLAHLRAALRDQSAQRAIQIATINRLIGMQIAPWRRAAFIVDAFAIVALGIVMFGVYTTTASLVVWRRREYAIRLALGATSTSLRVRLVADRACDVLIGGIAGGAASIWALPSLGGALHLPSDGSARFVLACGGMLLALAVGITGFALRSPEGFDPATVLQHG
jgi:putative ABC transport system permease protein